MKALLTCLVVIFCFKTYGQKTVFVSPVDQDLSIKTVALVPMVDNLSAIYSKPLGNYLNTLIANDKQWVLSSYSESKPPKPEDFEEKPDLAKAFLKKAKVDAFMTARLTKGPQGITIVLNLFSGKDGLLLAQSSLQNYQGFDLTDLRSQLSNLYEGLKRKIPYDGILLSRKGTLVTLNMGVQQGLTENQNINVIQITKIQRHPKFKFVVSSEKEILGKVKVQKVDENLSFGAIVSEREEGVLLPGQKFIVESFVKYPETPMTADQKMATDLNQRKDTAVAFGEGAKEWVPDRTPSFGKLSVLFGLSQYTLSSNLATSGGLSSTNSFAPTVKVDGEIWLNPEWFADVSLRQFIFSVSNPGSGSPSKLNVSTSQYTVLGGYNFLVAEKFFGPKIQLTAGYSRFSSSVDQASPRTSFTNQSYSGLVFGFGGSFPLELESKEPLSIGAHMNYFFSPGLEETPVDSGSATNNITSFSAFLIYGYSHRLNLKGSVDYDLFSSSFSGIGTRGESASSSSHGMTTLAAGIEYLF